jgi:hypothetical protein
MFIERSGTKIKKRYSSIGNPKNDPTISFCEKDQKPILTES